MGNNRDQFKDTGSVFLVIEMVHVRHGSDAGVHVLYSRPGAEAVMRKRWRGPQGIISGPQAADLSVQVSNMVTQALLGWTGITGVLET